MNIAKVASLYDSYSATSFHAGIQEVEEAEQALNMFLNTVSDGIKYELDLLVGKIIYAYEKQGFIFATSLLAGNNSLARGLASKVFENALDKKTAGTESQQKKREKHGRITPIVQLDIYTGELIAEYESQTQAHKRTGIVMSGINDCVTGKQKTCGGFIWKYKDTYLAEKRKA